MAKLQELDLVDSLTQWIHSDRPFFGICIGYQLLFESSEENPGVEGLSIFSGQVTKFPESELKVPHMGWNDLVIDHDHAVFDGLHTGDHTYFVHSYHMAVANPTERLAHVDYGGEVTAIIGRDTMLGMQFHPEKSQRVGLQILENFARLA